MPWCPVCKNEYIEGKTHCPDCDVDLVEELSEEPDAPDGNLSEMPDPEELQELAERAAKVSRMSTHVSAKDRQAETKSSAWTFLIVGGIWFVIVTLAIAGIIPLPLNTFSLAVMEGVAVIFLIIAGLSFRNAMRMLDDVSREDSLETRIQEWAKDHLSADTLTKELEEDTSEEMKYFILSEQIRRQIMEAFPEVDDAYAEELTEKYYNQLFE